ncbi:MAG: hypothetical protein PCFJNLEI_00115 [Verrucomicrobiae bacterium]|nr:hypothetical protein [Verrucomicrobiae bacterium]
MTTNTPVRHTPTDLVQRKILVVVATLVLVIALASIWRRLQPATHKIDRAPIIGAAAGIGEALARETLDAVHHQGRLIIVTDHDPVGVDVPRDYRWEAFQAELKQQKGVTIAGSEVVEFDPDEPMVSGCSSAALKQILNRHADVAAIVFLIDLPEWARVAGALPQNITAKIIAVDNQGISLRSHYSGYFSSGLLTALIARRSPLSDLPSDPKTPREWFDKYYQVYNRQNSETLSD